MIRHTKNKLLKPTYPIIEDRPEFQPAYTPAQMLELGVFGGYYFAEADRNGFKKLDPETLRLAKLNVGPLDPRRNCFGVKAGLDYADWHARGWIFDEDPLGWFHWYCRFYNGRRHIRDTHQINRWLKYKQRWGDRAASQLATRGEISSVIMQGLLQWSIDPLMRKRRK